MSDIKIEALTHGPKHHLFGFHDLICSNTKGDKILSLEVDVMNRPPLPRERFGVGYVTTDKQFVKVGETEALNYPQGSRLQWVADSNFFTTNNRVEKAWGTDIYDADTKKLVERLNAPTHALSPDGKTAYGLDYARLSRLGGYGYVGIEDANAHETAPANAGITVTDMANGVTKVLVSVREVVECDMKFNHNAPQHHYLTHLRLNPTGKRIAFLHRYFMPDGGMMTRLMTVGADGKGLRCIAIGFLSHFDWKGDERIYIYGRANSNLDSLRSNPLLNNPLLSFPLKIAKKMAKAVIGKKRGATGMGKSFIMITDSPSPVISQIGAGLLVEDGHPMTNPLDERWCINDTYPDKEGKRQLMLYNFDENRRVEIGTYQMIFDRPDMALANSYLAGIDKNILATISPEQLSFTRSGLHCDLHPRWCADGQSFTFDSIHEGTRQMYKGLINLQDL